MTRWERTYPFGKLMPKCQADVVSVEVYTRAEAGLRVGDLKPTLSSLARVFQGAPTPYPQGNINMPFRYNILYIYIYTYYVHIYIYIYHICILHEFVQEVEPSIPLQKESAEKDSRLEAPLRRNSVAFKKEDLASQICQVPAKGKGRRTLTKQSGSSNPVMMERRWQRF